MNNKLCFYCKLSIAKVVRSDGVVIYENSIPLKVPSLLPQTTVSSSQTEDGGLSVDEGDGPSGGGRP